jgi:hypothetical protein
MGQYSSVGIVTHYRLDSLGIKSQLGARFTIPVQTGPGVHLASYTVGNGSFPGVKQLGHDVDHPPPSSIQVKEGKLSYDFVSFFVGTNENLTSQHLVLLFHRYI